MNRHAVKKFCLSIVYRWNRLPNPIVSAFPLGETVSAVAARTGQITFDGLRRVRAEMVRRGIIHVYRDPSTRSRSDFLLGFKGSSFIESPSKDNILAPLPPGYFPPADPTGRRQ